MDDTCSGISLLPSSGKTVDKIQKACELYDKASTSREKYESGQSVAGIATDLAGETLIGIGLSRLRYANPVTAGLSVFFSSSTAPSELDSLPVRGADFGK